MTATITPLAGRAKPAASSRGSLGCNARGLSATEMTDPVLDAIAARVRLAHECLYTGEVEQAKDILKRLRGVLPEPSVKAMACACVEAAEVGAPGGSRAR